MKRTLVAIPAVLALAAAALAADAPGFKVLQKWPVPGNGGFDYIVFDNGSNRLYVSHGTQVEVLDAASGKILGKVEDTPGVHGIAIVPGLNRGFTTNGGDSTISVFDTTTFKTIKKIPVAKDPDYAFYDATLQASPDLPWRRRGHHRNRSRQAGRRRQDPSRRRSRSRRRQRQRRRLRQSRRRSRSRELRPQSPHRQTEMAHHRLQDAHRSCHRRRYLPPLHRLPQ